MRIIRLRSSGSNQAADKFEDALGRLTQVIETRVLAAFRALGDRAQTLAGGGFGQDLGSNFLGHLAAQRLAADRVGSAVYADTLLRQSLASHAQALGGQVRGLGYGTWSLQMAHTLAGPLRRAGFAQFEQRLDFFLSDPTLGEGPNKGDVVSPHWAVLAGGRPPKALALRMIQLRAERADEALANWGIQHPSHRLEAEEMRRETARFYERLMSEVQREYIPVVGPALTRISAIVGRLGVAGTIGAVAGAGLVAAMHGQGLIDARTREALALGEPRLMGVAQLAGVDPAELARGITAADQSFSGSYSSILLNQRIGPWLGNMHDPRNAGQYAIQAAEAIMSASDLTREQKRRAMHEIGMGEAMLQIDALGMDRWREMTSQAAAGNDSLSRFSLLYNYYKNKTLSWLAGLGDKLLGGGGGSGERSEAIESNTQAIRRLTDVLMSGQRQAFGSGRMPYEPVPTQWLLYQANMAQIRTQVARLSSV